MPLGRHSVTLYLFKEIIRLSFLSKPTEMGLFQNAVRGVETL